MLTLNESSSQTANTQNLRNGTAHEHFLASVRALAEFRFLQLPGYHILGCWLIPPSTDDICNDSFRSLLPTAYAPCPRRDLFKLRVNLAANGELYITPERNPSVSLLPINLIQPPPEGTVIYLSPSGCTAEFLSILGSSPQTSTILQKIRSTSALEAKFPLMRVRLASGIETLWPANLAFLRCPPKSASSNDHINYFNLKDGVSSAVRLISDALTYKPPPAPSPALMSTVAAHVTPSGVYHTPPDGITRSNKTVITTAQTPSVNQTVQEEWTAAKDGDPWPSIPDGRGDDEDYTYGTMEDTFDVREEDFNFFDDEPPGEFDDTEGLVEDIPASSDQMHLISEGKVHPMGDVKLEKSPTPAPVVELQMVLSPPYSPLRILPSPPPTRRGTFPKIWDHVRLSGNLERVQDKYRRGGKYWCEDLDEGAIEDDSMSNSSSDEDAMDWISANPRKRKRDEDEDGSKLLLSGPSLLGPQSLDSDTVMCMARAIDENLLMLQRSQDELFHSMPKTDEKSVDYANGLDHKAFTELAETIASQVCWDGMGLFDAYRGRQEVPMEDFSFVIMNIWGADASNNPGLKELTEVVDIIPTFNEEDSPSNKTPRMKATKSPHARSSSFSLVSNVEQTQSIYPIPPPSFLVHRIHPRNPPAPNHIQRLSVSTPALRFWEKFSFSPVAGRKDVRCYVVHPDSEGMSTAVDLFLSEIQTAWESCGMGEFERGKVNESGRDGMITINVPQGSDEEVCLVGYQDALVNFGKCPA